MPEEIMLWKKQVQIIIFKLKEGPPWARVPKVRRKVSFRVKSCVVERILFSLSESEKEKREPASGGGAAPRRISLTYGQCLLKFAICQQSHGFLTLS